MCSKRSGTGHHLSTATCVACSASASSTIARSVRTASHRAQLAIAGMVRALIDDDLDRLSDPQWIEQVVKVAIRAIAE
jgi:hypothetical protein